MCGGGAGGGVQKSLPKFLVYLEEHFTKNNKPGGICYVSYFPPCKGLLKLFFFFFKNWVLSPFVLIKSCSNRHQLWQAWPR